MKRTIVISAPLFVVLLLLIGCSTVPKTMTYADASNIRKMAVVTRCPDKELKIFDRTGVWGKTYTGYQFGALGGLIEGIVLAIEAKIKIGKSLGGDPDLLREQLKDYPIETVFNENFKKSFATKYEIVYPDEVDIVLQPQAAEGTNIEDYSILRKDLNADTVLIINYIHGLAAYNGRPASAAISANVTVVNTSDNRCLMKKRLDTDRWFNDGHIIDEFKANDAELYKKNVIQAIGVISKEIESIFDLAKLQVLSGEETTGATNSKDSSSAVVDEKRSNEP